MKLIYPLLAQVAWTIIVGILMGRSRAASVKNRDVKIGQVALGNDAWPDKVKAVGNNYANQFETPVLFYVLCGVAIYVGATGWLTVALAWIYVATRIGHTYVHIGTNHVPTRFNIFLAGMLTLVALLVVVTAKALHLY